jgi:hypothetical protein
LIFPIGFPHVIETSFRGIIQRKSTQNGFFFPSLSYQKKNEEKKSFDVHSFDGFSCGLP